MSSTTGPRRYDLAVLIHAQEVGGVERHTTDLLNYLSATGLRIVLLQSGADLRSMGLRQIPGALDVVDAGLPMRDVAPQQLREWFCRLREHRADRILLVKHWYYDADAGFLRMLRKAAPVVFQFEHSLPPRIERVPGRRLFGLIPRPGLGWWKERWRRWRMGRLVDRVFVDSEAARRELLEHALLTEDQVVACLNGLDVDRWAPDEEKARAFRDRYGIPRDCYLFGAAGRLDPLKGTDLALRSYARFVRGGRDDVRLCVVGGGPRRDEFERLARQLDLEDRVCFTGYVDDIGAALSAIDSLLFPSLLESCPLILLEAMACGCRIIASPVGGVPELMGDPDCGDLAPSRDPGDWAAVMHRHVGTPPHERAALAARIRDFVANHHDQRRQFRMLAEAFGAPQLAGVRS